MAKSKLGTQPQPVDHLGLWLSRAYHAFKREMLARLQNAGFDDLTPIFLLIIPRVTFDGIAMADLVSELGMSKQAVSRALRDMASANYVVLAEDPRDKRAKVVSLGPRGIELAHASMPIKKQMHRRLRSEIGSGTLKGLSEALEHVEASFNRGAELAVDES